MLKSIFQLIHTKVSSNDGRRQLFITIYANLNNDQKNVLWRDLHEMSLNINKAWLLVRDFNNIRDPSEKKGGAPFNWYQANIFNN